MSSIYKYVCGILQRPLDVTQHSISREVGKL